MKTSLPIQQKEAEKHCQAVIEGHFVTESVTLYQLRLENDRLTYEAKALRKQVDQLIEVNKQLKAQLDNARQMHFSTYGNCVSCGEPLPPREDTGRDRKYCSDACKMRAYRKRKRELRKCDE